MTISDDAKFIAAFVKATSPYMAFLGTVFDELVEADFRQYKRCTKESVCPTCIEESFGKIPDWSDLGVFRENQPCVPNFHVAADIPKPKPDLGNCWTHNRNSHDFFISGCNGRRSKCFHLYTGTAGRHCADDFRHFIRPEEKGLVPSLLLLGPEMPQRRARLGERISSRFGDIRCDRVAAFI